MRTPRWPALVHAALVLPLACLFVSGCRPAPQPVTPVQGKVTYKGLPLTGGTIVFTPDSVKGHSGKAAHSKIAADGTYQLVTGESKGASPGHYRITVVSLAHTNPPDERDRFKPPLSLLPEKYRDPDLSELACEVKASKTNILDFDLN